MLRLVSDVEASWLRKPGERKRGSTYRKIHNWLLKEEYFTRLLIHKRTDILPGLRVRGPSLLWRRFLGTRVRGACVADAVRVKSHLRAFYPRLQTPAVTKILLGQGLAGAQKLRDEIATRSQVRAFGCLTIPEVLAYDVDKAYPWYAEQLIRGRTASGERAVIAEKLVPALIHMYQRFGVVWRTPGSILGSGWQEALKRAVGRIRWQLDWPRPAELLERVSRVIQGPAVLPCSTGHGDLSPTNLIVTPEGSICVIDWEHAGFRPVMFDLAPLIGVEKAIRKHFAFLAAPAAASFEEQYLLAVAFQLMQWERQSAERRTAAHPPKRLPSQLSQLFAQARANCCRSLL